MTEFDERDEEVDEFDEETFLEEDRKTEWVSPRDVVLGDLYGNADKIAAEMHRAFHQWGKTHCVTRRCDIQGGRLGASMRGHKVFKKALVDAEEYLRSKIENMGFTLDIEDIEFADDGGAPVAYLGGNPRKPFGADVGAIFHCLFTGLADRLRAINCKHVVIGLSGGLDSTLALLVAARACDKRHIHVYTMPGFGTSGRTRGNAEKLCRGLGLTLETISIVDACRQHFKDIGHDENVHDVVYENVQARERTQILMDKANQVGGIVLGTGDMSEIALGWSTYNGDHMSMFAVNAGVPKTTVRDVCAWWAKHHAGEAADAVNDIIATPVSPELLPGKDGEIAQKTEDKVGPYELHDFFLFHFIEKQRGRQEIVEAAVAAFEGDYDRETIEKWLDVFFRRFFTQAFKRNCQPDGIPIFSVYLSPERFRVPSGFSPNVFLRRV